MPKWFTDLCVKFPLRALFSSQQHCMEICGCFRAAREVNHMFCVSFLRFSFPNAKEGGFFLDVWESSKTRRNPKKIRRAASLRQGRYFSIVLFTDNYSPSVFLFFLDNIPEMKPTIFNLNKQLFHIFSPILFALWLVNFFCSLIYQRLLTMDPSTRIGAGDALNHPYFSNKRKLFQHQAWCTRNGQGIILMWVFMFELANIFLELTNNYWLAFFKIIRVWG